MCNINPAANPESVDKLRPLVVNLGIIGFYAEAHLSLAHRLLTGKERVDRVLTQDQLDTRAQYMAALPKLCADVKRLTVMAKQLCQAMLQAPKQNQRCCELREAQVAIFQLLDQYHLQKQVSAEMLPNVLVIRRQLDWCFQAGKERARCLSLSKTKFNYM